MRNKPRGSHGSRFAEWENERIPILWKHQFQYCGGEPHIITDWIGRERPNTANKRERIRKFYEEHLNAATPAKVVLAIPKKANPDKGDVPEIGSYAAVFGIVVDSVDPEIKLKVVERLWPSC